MSTNCFPHASQTWIWVLVFWFEELFILGIPNLALAKVAGVASPFQGVPDLVVCVTLPCQQPIYSLTHPELDL